MALNPRQVSFTETHRGKGDEKMKVEIRVMQLQAKECQQSQ